MSVIRAFIGHSFDTNDQILIDIFLKYFNQIKDLGIGFTWDHAQAAEPIELTKKVISLIQGKNLFVGICTKREFVIGPNDLKHHLLRRNVLSGHVEKFLWKTSDWIIQEIGLAVGRKMDLILLIEKGLRPPGGLQGNIEFIPFDRESPQSSFGQILEMIRTLIPKAVKASIQESGASTSESAVQVQGKEEIDSALYEPKPEWDFSHYQLALFSSIKTGNHDAEEKITSAFLKSPLCKGPSDSASWEANRQYIRLSLGKGGDLINIEQLAKDKPEFDEVHYYLGRSYHIYKEHRKAAQAYLHAAERALDSEFRLLYLGDAVIEYCHGDMKLEAEDIAEKMRKEVLESGVGEEILIKGTSKN